MTVALALTPDTRWDVDSVALVDVAARAGFGALGILDRRAASSASRC